MLRTGLGMALAAVLMVLPAGAADKLAEYTYQDTKDLVSLVEDAAQRIETVGDAAFAEFGKPGSRWLNNETYLFAYAPDGTAAFHPVSPELVGKNVIDLKDLNGKLLVQEIVDVAKLDAPDANRWVFYLWQDQRELSPIWKASYIRKAITPEGKVYLIGSGLYDVKVEKAFVTRRVNRAVELLQSAGKEEAFRQFRDSASPFVFLGTYVFVLSETGETLVDPAFPNLSGRNMLGFRDAVGFEPIRQLVDKLKTADEAWVQFLWPEPGAVVPSRKLVYARKVTDDGEAVIVGSGFYIATPIWMKVEEVSPWRQNQPG